MVVSTQAFHVPGVAITNAQAVTRMAETLAGTIGPVGFYAYAIGFWAAVFASLLGVWQSLPYLFADYYGLLRGYPRAIRDDITKVTSRPYRLALFFVTVVPLPFAFVDQPLVIIRTFTIVGSLFIPFLAGTLLYLNNARIPIESGVPAQLAAGQRRAGAGRPGVRRGRRDGGRTPAVVTREDAADTVPVDPAFNPRRRQLRRARAGASSPW